MRRSLALLTIVLVLGACSSDDAGPSASPDSSAARAPDAGDRPAWLEDLGAPATAEEGVTVRGTDGETERVWVDQAARMVYAPTCDIARKATEAGGHYGPGNFGPGPGFAYVCP
jgi:hypothetical protein